MSKIILADDPEADWENALQFRLTYEGHLYATQRDSTPNQPSRHMGNKHNMRMVFHQQLERLWRELPALNGSHNRGCRPILMTPGGFGETKPIRVDDIAKNHAMYGREFVPIVTDSLELMCDIDILFLRPEKPGSVIWAGDIDNRLKTLLDALRIPEAAEKYAERDDAPARMFCLLEDDKLITRVSVETDRLLMPVSEEDHSHDVRIVITVRLKPYSLSIFNMEFG